MGHAAGSTELPMGAMAGFGSAASDVDPPGAPSEPMVAMAAFATCTPSEASVRPARVAVTAKRKYRATVSRSTPNSRAIRRADQPVELVGGKPEQLVECFGRFGDLSGWCGCQLSLKSRQ
jgi:hypothetical protein